MVYIILLCHMLLLHSPLNIIGNGYTFKRVANQPFLSLSAIVIYISFYTQFYM